MSASDECFLFVESGGQRWPCRHHDIIGRAGTVAPEVLRHVGTLSRRHLQIEKRGPAWYVMAFPEARNTTWMEGQPMQRGVAYPLFGVRSFQVDQFQFFLATANGMMTQAWMHGQGVDPGAAAPPPVSEPIAPMHDLRRPLHFPPGAMAALTSPVAPSGPTHAVPIPFGILEAPPPPGIAIDDLPGAVVETDLRLHLRAANAGARALFGDACLGRDLDEWSDEKTRLRDFLMRLGPGQSGDPIVTRFHLREGARELELLANRRIDTIIVCVRDASGQKSREEELSGTAGRLARQTRVLADFSLSPAFKEGDLAKSLSMLTVQGAEGLECRRVSVWLAIDDSSDSVETIVCRALHDRRGPSVPGARTARTYCPAFFDAVKENAWSMVPAGTPLISMLAEIGFIERGSGDVLSVALQQGGTFYGIMSFEREAGDTAGWNDADRDFALCLASFGTAALQAAERHEAFARLRESEKHMAAELAEADRYVRRVLPEPVSTGAITTEWQIVPSEKVGGDSFGYHWITDDLFALYILDVVGHGTGAALLSVSVLNTVRARLPAGEAALGHPARVLGELNEAFPMEQQNGMTFTMWYGVFDRRGRTLTYASGGHPPAILLLGEVPEGHADYAALATEGPVLGGLSGIEFSEACVRVPHGSKLFLCTDGAFEIPLGADREWTFEEFIATIRSTRWMDGGETSYLHKRIGALCAVPRFPDDFCVVRFSFTP